MRGREKECMVAMEKTGSSDSLHGLKFGKKIYFEDGGGGGSGEAPAAKKGKGVAQQQQPPRCQVEGCNVDLSDAKAYYSRHKVCGMHSKTPKVVVAGLEQRFCQQCSRFHLLPEFDQGKRSCRRRLAGHNERRRKPPPGSSSMRYGQGKNRFRGFLLDFSYPRLQGAPTGTWPTVGPDDQVVSDQWPGRLNAPPTRIMSHGGHLYMQGPTSGPLFSPGIPPGECLAGVASDSRCALSLLSTQHPWGSTAAAHTRAAGILKPSSFDGSSMACPVISNSYANTAWGFKSNEHGNSSHRDQHAIGLGQVNQAENSQFPGELELALQGNRQCMDLEPGRAYDHSDDVNNWSL